MIWFAGLALIEKHEWFENLVLVSWDPSNGVFCRFDLAALLRLPTLMFVRLIFRFIADRMHDGPCPGWWGRL